MKFKTLPWRDAYTLAKKAVVAWSDDYAPSMGAALSYYSVFSMGPLVLIVISVAGLVFGQNAVRGELFGQLRGLMGDQGAAGVEALLASVSKPSSGIIGTAVGVTVLLIGASTVFGELQSALDRIWRAPTVPRASGLWTLLRTRFLSFGMILGIAFLLMVSLVLGAAIAAIGRWWGPAFGDWELVGHAVNVLLGYAVTTGAFAMIYKLMPRAAVQWHDVWIGAAFTAGLFTVGRFLIGLYIGKTGIASGFGAAGSVAVIFVWVYYSAQVFLLGAEFTWVYAQTYGSMRPAVAGLASAAADASDPALPNAAESTPTPPVAMAPVGGASTVAAAAPSTGKLALGVVIGLCAFMWLPRFINQPRLSTRVPPRPGRGSTARAGPGYNL